MDVAQLLMSPNNGLGGVLVKDLGFGSVVRFDPYTQIIIF